MCGRNEARPTAAAAVQHIPANAARPGESAAQATSSGASDTQAAIVHDSGGNAAANPSPESLASANGASAPARAVRRARPRDSAISRSRAAFENVRPSTITPGRYEPDRLRANLER